MERVGDAGAGCRRGCWLGGRLSDPACLPAAVGGQAHRAVAGLSGDERRWRGGLRHQRLVARRIAVRVPQRTLAVDRSNRIMADLEEKRIVDLSHVIEHGMTTFKGLPGPHICDFWERESTAANYEDGSSFQIGRIDMVANTGTYVDSPFHRYADGLDLADLPLPSLADLPGIVIRRPWENGIEMAVDAFEDREVRGKA